MKDNMTKKEIVGKKVSLSVILLIYLLAGTLTAFVSYSYARWQSTASGSDLARVAIFAVDAQGQSANNLQIDCDAGVTSAEYVVTVTNHENDMTTEVAVEYTIAVKLPKVLPEGVSMMIDSTSPVISADKLTYTFANADWQFPAGVTSTQNHTLTISADPDVVLRDTTINNIQVQVTTRQID